MRQRENSRRRADLGAGQVVFGYTDVEDSSEGLKIQLGLGEGCGQRHKLLSHLYPGDS